jgi:hypothetical protein
MIEVAEVLCVEGWNVTACSCRVLTKSRSLVTVAYLLQISVGLCLTWLLKLLVLCVQVSLNELTERILPPNKSTYCVVCKLRPNFVTSTPFITECFSGNWNKTIKAALITTA